MADDPWAEKPEGDSDKGQPTAEGDAAPSEDWAASMAEQGGDSAAFDSLGSGTTDEEGSQNLGFLLDIPLEVSVQLGNTKMIINEMLQLTQGSVVELTKAAGEPVDIYVNQKLLGKGEVLVVNDRYGVRITEIISQAERVENMR